MTTDPATDLFVGLDNGGTSNNATVLAADGEFLIVGLRETPSRVREGPEVALDALAGAFDDVLAVTGQDRARVRAVGLDTPGPASADGVISTRGSTNFEHPGWRGFDVRTELQERLGVPVVYNNDGNAAALYAHTLHHGAQAARKSSISAIIGTGLGGGIICDGDIVRGAAGMAGEIGHVHIPLEGLLQPGQPVPSCNCGFTGDAESFASLTGIERNLLPYWLGRYPDHPLHAMSPRDAARAVRGYGEAGDELARKIFEQQASALGRLFTIAANMLDPDTYFIGGGAVEAAPEFVDWFVARVRAHTQLRDEQRERATFELVPERDMAGARGSALAAAASFRSGQPMSLGEGLRGPSTLPG